MRTLCIILMVALTGCDVDKPVDHPGLHTETGLFDDCINHSAHSGGDVITACQQAAKEQYESQHGQHP